MTSLRRLMQDHPVRVSVGLTVVLAVVELVLLTLPITSEARLFIARWLPLAGALVGGLLIRSWWWLLVYPVGCVIGLMVLAGWGLARGESSSLGEAGGGVVVLALFFLPQVVLLAGFGPLMATIDRLIRQRPRRPVAAPPDQEVT